MSDAGTTMRGEVGVKIIISPQNNRYIGGDSAHWTKILNGREADR